MAQIAHTRSFNGSSDYIQCADGALESAIAGFTVAAIVLPDAGVSGFDVFFACTDPDGLSIGVQGGELYMYAGGSIPHVDGASYAVNANGWMLLAVTKATGTTNPHWHKYEFDAGTWDHQTDGDTHADPSTPSGSEVYIGKNGATGQQWQGKIACVGVWWGSALSDANLETLTDSITSWEALSPTALWLLNQSSTATAVVDRTGSGATESGISGTTATATSDLVFDTPVVGYVGSNGSAENSGSASSISFTTTRTISVGERVVLAASCNDSVSPTTVTVGSLSLTQDADNALANMAIYSKLATAEIASGATVTVNYSGSIQNRAAMCFSLSEAGDPVDTAFSDGFDTSPTTGASALSYPAGSAIVGSCWLSIATTIGPAGGETEVFDSSLSFDDFAVQYELNSTAGTGASTWTLGGTQTWETVGVVYPPETPPSEPAWPPPGSEDAAEVLRVVTSGMRF